MTNFFDPLRARLALALAVALVPIVIYDLILAYRGYQDAEARGWATVRQLAIVASANQNALIEGTRRLMVGLGESAAVRAAADGSPTPDCSRTMARVLTTLPEYSDLAVVDRQGRVQCSAVDRSIGASVVDTPWFKGMTETQGFTLGYFTLSRETAEPIVSALLPASGSDGTPAGAIVAGIRLPWLGSLAQKHGLPENGIVYLLDSKGTVMTSSDRFLAVPEPAHGIPQSRKSPADEAAPDKAILTEVAQRRVTEFVSTGADGRERFFSAANLQNGSLYILFGMPSVSAMSWSFYQTLAFIIGPLLMLMIAIGVAVVGGELLIARGIRALLATVDAYGRDELDAKPDVGRSPREIRQFADAFAGMARKISDRETELRRSLDEKDALLREVHHRVKNNLQIVTSFLNLQSKSTKDGAAREVLTEARVRVRTLALVHRYLYESADVRQVDFASITEALADQLGHAHSLGQRGISIRLALDSVPIPAAAAVPVALLITEALSNAVKHGYPDGARGVIDLSFSRGEDGNAELRIADDGAGLPVAEDGQARIQPGIGMALMQAFARQLGGKMRLEAGDPSGAVVVVDFPLAAETDDHGEEGADAAA
ncbi:two-component sensor histidine kinase [Stella humosa]|uniref:histidine kinase n=1 Tax=Stella humosa TaxID=94 RepID=A0A3N1KPR8_9PROT|nr:two-component sensor histidine kinase [Stella humosa]BBK32976.1 histidine kinase [Stella humosa]